ncbi:MAG TPA: hypothetical protein VMU03_08675 [Gammaproteobacteria bacterium]|jgi:hypothetical protein|nr:hypothetical protein [Gammaproteobacteria bacterium]
MVLNGKVSGTVIGVAAALVWLQLYPQSASAQDRESDRERGGIYLGAFITNRNTEARVDPSNGGGGTDVDLEGDLGLDSSTSVARFGGYFWLSRRQRLDVSYFDLSRTANHRLQKQVIWGDQTFNINTVLSTDNSLTITKVDYTFSFLNKERGYLGFTAGLYVANTKFSLSEPQLGKFESSTLTAPLPVIGLRGEYAITKHFNLRGATQWFGIDVGDVSGRLTDTYAGVDYGLGKRMFVGLAYDTVSMRIDASKGSLSGRLDWGYDGWLAYFKMDFGGGVSNR